MKKCFICMCVFAIFVIFSAAKVDVSSCSKKYKRKLNGDKATPSLLYSFPGAGNTWVRLLIEYSTGVYSGSVYSDMQLVPTLPGEVECSKHVSVVKAHPHTHSARDLLDGKLKSDFNKCARGHVNRFDKVVLLIRDPFDSIWSEYQRRVSSNHVGTISKVEFDWVRWIVNAGYLSYQYLRMWDEHYAYIFKKLPKSNILLIKYEDLRNLKSRRKTLRLLVDFLNISSAFAKGGGDSVVVNGVKYSLSYAASHLQSARHTSPTIVTDEHIDCAFELAESRKVKRMSLSSGSGSDVVRKEDAYVQDIACRMWNLFSNVSQEYGYSSFGNNKFDCRNYSAIEDFNLGSSCTDYNRLINGAQHHVKSDWVNSISQQDKSLESKAKPTAMLSHTGRLNVDLSIFDYRGKSSTYSIGNNNIKLILHNVSGSDMWIPKFHKNLSWSERMDLINKRLSIQSAGNRDGELFSTAFTGKTKKAAPGGRDMMSRLKSQSKSKV